MGTGFIRDALRLMRPRQWVKSGFILAPLFFGAKLNSSESYAPLSAALISFSLVSSAVYILNDICDAKADRYHERKRLRPIASGAISPGVAGGLGVLLLAAATATAFAAALPPSFYTVLASYLLVNLGYSLGLKHIAVLELFMVSSGFVLRLLVGGIVTDIELSPWIIVATGMISLLLVTGKRRADLALNNDPRSLRRALQGYSIEYLDAVLSAVGGGTLIVFLLFCASDYAERRYGQGILLTSIPVGLGVLRFIQIVMVKKDGDSPTDLVVRDGFILACLGVFMLMMAVLLYVKPFRA
jgi:4-hydroxybenzoate polyprenyltransferase